METEYVASADQQAVVAGRGGGIRAVEKLAEVVEATRDSVDELLVWAQQPLSTDLAETIGRLAECVSAMHVSLVELGHQLPGQVADAVQRAR